MSRGNYHAWGAVANVRKAFAAHSDTCEWPKGCDRPSRWYHTTITGRWSVCDKHCPVAYRTHPIPPRDAA